MFYHNLKLAFRNLWGHKTFSFLNILGLTIGLASCIIIGLYAWTELSFDHFHKNHSRVFRINKITNEKGKRAQKDGLTPGQLGPALENEIPGVAAATRFRPWFSEMLVSYNEIKLKLKDVSYADASFLEIFDFPLSKGDKATALREPFTAVVTEETAHLLFGNSNPIGKTLITLNDMPVKITGVTKNIPSNSSIQFPMLISWSTLTASSNADNFSWMNSWSAQVSFTFVQIKEHTDPILTGNKISSLLHAHFPEKEFEYTTYLQSLNDIHLNSEGILCAAQFRTGSSTIVYTLIVIAIFIILIASFNFINLTSAGALGRAKETGVQKVLGAAQAQLIRKFMGESFVLCLFAFLLSCGVVVSALPFFNELANSNLSARLLLQPASILALLLLLVLISVIAGLYPAVFLSKFKTTDIFRNVIKAGRGAWLRKSLVATQFALSILLIVATIVVNRQVHYLAAKDLGFNKEQLIILPLANTNLANNPASFIDALKSYPGIIDVTATDNIPGQGFNSYGVVPERHTVGEHLLANVLKADANFASAYGIQLTRGRFFSPQFPADTNNSIVINEAMARYINWKDAVGKQLEIYEEMKGKVIGVIKDFNFASLRENIQPLAILLRNEAQFLSVKVKPGSARASLDHVTATWKQFEPKYPFDYFFMDEKMNQYYQSDIRLLNVLAIFSGIAICIACMGLFGLSIHTARQRVKEIGIRKVLGASAAQVALLLSADFLKLVFIAAIIAIPVAWWTMNNWLQGFANRIDISLSVFLIAGLLASFIALFTISFQAIKAAMANPVKSLRAE